MKLKKAVAVTLVASSIIALGIFGFAIAANNSDNDQQAISSMSVAEPEVAQTGDSTMSDQEAVANTDAVSDTCGVKGGECSTIEIAKRDSQDECWVIYRGNYYDVTSYIQQHSGGSVVFNEDTCGEDIQAYLEGSQSTAGRQKTHSSRAYSDLERLKIGSVKSD